MAITRWPEIKKKYKIYSSQKYGAIKTSYVNPKAFEDAVTENPYQMIHVYLNKPFKQANQLVLQLFPRLRKSMMRCKWCCLDRLKKNESYGHTRMGASQLFGEVSKEYPEVSEFIFEAVTKSDMFYYEPERKLVSLMSTYEDEERIANTIRKKLSAPVEDSDMNWEEYKEVDGFKLTDEQIGLLKAVCENNVVMLNGSAGTGKTSATKALVQMLEDNLKSFTLLAPTGIAAKRLAQATGYSASTIHRHLASRHFIGDYLIIDEMSMVGVGLLASLFYNIPDKTKIIFICDEAQLASISCGNIVKDIVDSGIVPIVNLTKVFRYGIGGIATVATDIRNGKPLTTNMNFDDFAFEPIIDNPIDSVLSVYNGLLTNYDKDDIMILSPFNVQEAGTYAINNAIQSAYNSNPVLTSYTRQSTEISFKRGDRIVNTENNYHIMSDYGEIAVMNGDMGHVLDYDEHEKLLRVEFDDGVAHLETGDVFKQLLGYCISVHKSQGTQAKAVIVVIDSSHGFFLTRNLCYVATSRAQEKLIIVGDINTINNALDVQEEKRRNTWLRELLIKEEC